VTLKGTAEDGQRMGDEESFYGNFFLKWLPSSRWKITLNVKAQRDQSNGASMYYQAVENEVVAVKNPYKMAVNSLGSNSRSLVNASLAANYYHAKFSFVSVSAYQYILQTYKNIDQDLFPYALATGATYDKRIGDPMPQRVVSQEFRFSSAPSSQKVTWTAGTYFFYQQYNKRYAATYEKLALLFGEQPGVKVSQTDDKNSGIAAFGEATYHLKKRWAFTLGLRYDFENRSTVVGKFDIDSANNKTYSVPLNNRSKSFHALSPKAVVGYKLNENHHVYISYSRGFRAGGINISTKVSGYETYKPEYSDNAELGYKFNSANNRYSLQSSFFYLYWHDLQLDLRTDGGVYVINNIGNVQSLGFEIEATAKPVKNLMADASIGYNHSRYQDFYFLGQNIKGNKTIMAPAVTVFAGLQYLVELPKDFGIMLRGECRYMGEQYFDLINTIKQPGYVLFNARTEVKYKYVSLAFWIQNIANQKYIAYAMPGYFRYTILNRPRSFGVTLTANF
jgi:iron complex outermembrane receptor protein